jgi:hypothetical protein
MDLDTAGNVISGFLPPTDETGRALSYEEYRERSGFDVVLSEVA